MGYAIPARSPSSCNDADLIRAASSLGTTLLTRQPHEQSASSNLGRGVETRTDNNTSSSRTLSGRNLISQEERSAMNGNVNTNAESHSKPDEGYHSLPETFQRSSDRLSTRALMPPPPFPAGSARKRMRLEDECMADGCVAPQDISTLTLLRHQVADDRAVQSETHPQVNVLRQRPGFDVRGSNPVPSQQSNRSSHVSNGKAWTDSHHLRNPVDLTPMRNEARESHDLQRASQAQDVADVHYGYFEALQRQSQPMGFRPSIPARFHVDQTQRYYAPRVLQHSDLQSATPSRNQLQHPMVTLPSSPLKGNSHQRSRPTHQQLYHHQVRSNPIEQAQSAAPQHPSAGRMLTSPFFAHAVPPRHHESQPEPIYRQITLTPQRRSEAQLVPDETYTPRAYMCQKIQTPQAQLSRPFRLPSRQLEHHAPYFSRPQHQQMNSKPGTQLERHTEAFFQQPSTSVYGSKAFSTSECAYQSRDLPSLRLIRPELGAAPSSVSVSNRYRHPRVQSTTFINRSGTRSGISRPSHERTRESLRSDESAQYFAAPRRSVQR